MLTQHCPRYSDDGSQVTERRFSPKICEKCGLNLIIELKSVKKFVEIGIGALPLLRLNRLKRPNIETWPFQTEILFPQGLLGFQNYKRYLLIGNKQEIPFLKLEALENRALAFYVMDPFLECPDYTPTLSQTDLKDVGVIYEAKLILLAIVNMIERPYVMNLAAPLLIHWSKRKGKQLLTHGDPEYIIKT